MKTRAKTFMTALNNPQPRDQVLIAYLAVTMCIAGVYQTAQITEPVGAVGVPNELAPILVVFNVRAGVRLSVQQFAPPTLIARDQTCLLR